MAYGVRLDLRPVETLRPHEETIESSTLAMVAQLERDGVQKDPIIVDDATGVILDGMHRLSAFRHLGIRYAACSPVDYSSAEITLGRWLRVYRARGEENAAGMAEAVGLTVKRSVSEALSMLGSRKSGVAAFTEDGAHLPTSDGGLASGFGTVRTADVWANFHGWQRSFTDEGEILRQGLDRREIALLVMRFGKEDVLEAGVTGALFPCKTSMHVVDPRPVAVNVPLGELRAGKRDTLWQRLKEERFELLPPGTEYEGRKYKERLMVLSPR